jgi:CRISPR/Cas system-associated endoribonuclease Cas2
MLQKFCITFYKICRELEKKAWAIAPKAQSFQIEAQLIELKGQMLEKLCITFYKICRELEKKAWAIALKARSFLHKAQLI